MVEMYHLPCISATFLLYQFTAGAANSEAYQDQAIRLMSERSQMQHIIGWRGLWKSKK